MIWRDRFDVVRDQKARRHDASGDMYWTHTQTAHIDDGRSETISPGKCCTHTQKYLCRNSFDGTVTYWQVCHHRPTRANHPSFSVAYPIMSLRLHTALCWIAQIRACVVYIPGTETVIKV